MEATKSSRPVPLDEKALRQVFTAIQWAEFTLKEIDAGKPNLEHIN